MDTEPIVVPPEELAEEQSAIQLPKEEEVRAELATELDLDPEADKERLDKVVAREMKSRSNLSKAIGQKRSWRDKATKPPEKPILSKKKEEDDDEPKGLSSEDVLTLVGVGVSHREDIDWLKKQALIHEKPLSDIIGDADVMATLKTRQEIRKSADASNTFPARPGSKKKTDAEVLAAAAAGDIPEPGTPEAQALFDARRNAKRK